MSDEGFENAHCHNPADALLLLGLAQISSSRIGFRLEKTVKGVSLVNT